MTPEWESLVALARSNLCPDRFPDISPEQVTRRLVEYRCSPKYPEVVAHNLMLARELCVAGTLFYELFTVALHYTAVACECALKEIYVARLPVPFTMRRKRSGISEEKTFHERPSTLEFFHMGWKLRGKAAAETRNFSSLIEWGKRKGVLLPEEVQEFEHGRHTRNLTAHGHNMVGDWTWAIGAVRGVTLVLNRLFPDPETTAYDEENRRRREEERRAWDAGYGSVMTTPGEEEEDPLDEEP
jgi:hypothetical protein